MPLPLNTLPGGVPLDLTVAPALQTSAIHSPGTDLIQSDGECFAIQLVGEFAEENTWTGRIEQSADTVSWAPIPGAVFATVREGPDVQVIRFLRTARYLRYASAVVGETPSVVLAVLLGQPRKSY